MSSFYADYADEYKDKGFSPIPILGKGLPVPGATGREGTVTPEKIERWKLDPTLEDRQIGIRLEDGYIGIDVDHYGDKTGNDELETLEFQYGTLPATISTTSRGQDSLARTYIYEVPQGLEFATKASANIDIIQRKHRYSVVFPSAHPSTGSLYEWYDEDGEPIDGIPDISSAERLPDAWVDYLVTPTVTTHDGFTGSIEQWLETLPDGAPSPAVKKFVESIPTEDFGHDEMVRITYHLVRLGSEGNPGIREAMTTLYREWTREPYDTAAYEREISDAIQGAIKKAGAPFEPEGLPSFEDAIEQIPGEFASSLFGEPMQKGQLNVLRDLMRLKLPREVILSVAWHAPALKGAWSYDRLVDLVMDMEYERKASSGEIVTPAPVVKSESPEVKLLEDDERLAVSKMSNFVTEYLSWSKSRSGKFWNAPLDEMNAFITLSVCYCDSGYIPLDDGAGGSVITLYGMNISKTTTGKTKAKDRMMSVINAVFRDEATPSIGMPGSSNALKMSLLERDGEPVFLSQDEAHGWLSRLNNDSTMRQVAEDMAEVYDGRVQAQILKSLGEMSGKGARARVTSWLQGTPDKMYEQLTEAMFESGFLARYIYCIGNDRIEADRPQRTKLGRGNKEGVIDPWVEKTAAVVKNNRFEYGRTGRFMPISFDVDAIERLDDVRFLLGSLVDEQNPQFDILSPSLGRLSDNIWRASSLIGMSEGERHVKLEHVLFVLSYAEKWLKNLFEVVQHVSATEFERSAAAIREFVTRHGRVRREEAYRRVGSKFQPIDFKQRIDYLVQTGQIQVEDKDSGTFLVVKEAAE